MRGPADQGGTPTIRRVALLSLEPWDQVWRRNQHLSTSLVEQGLVEHLLFVEPARRRGRLQVRHPRPGITALRPVQTVPNRLGGRHLTAAWLRRTVIRGADVLWVNDAVLGALCLRDDVPALYDVTDDWREFAGPARIRDAQRRAEDLLSLRARTVVCSDVLAQRWRGRYGIDPLVVPNAVDPADWATARPRQLPGPGPHVGYVGTLHPERLDVELVAAIARSPSVGTLHLVGPDHLTDPDRQRLRVAGVHVHGAVPREDVPGWMLGCDVLVVPHRVTPFTMSLDAIKAYEYRAAGRPVVATPTSGFQSLADDGAAVVEAEAFVRTLAAVIDGTLTARPRSEPPTWDERARALAPLLSSRAWAGRAKS